MLEGFGDGSFRDITIEARLLDILGVDYSERDAGDPLDSPNARKMNSKHHENGKGLAHGDMNGGRLPGSYRNQQQRSRMAGIVRDHGGYEGAHIPVDERRRLEQLDIPAAARQDVHRRRRLQRRRPSGRESI